MVTERAPSAWARPQRGGGLLAIAGLFAAVTALRWFVDGSGQAAALLYVVPIALAALWYGRRAGVAAAAIGAAAFVVLAVVDGHGDLDVTGWAGPVLVLFLVGTLVGHLVERAERDRTGARHLDPGPSLEELRREQAAAVAAGDSVVQEVAAARWLLEAGHTEEAMGVLGVAVAGGISRFSEMMSDPVTGEAPGGRADPVGPRRRTPLRRRGLLSHTRPRRSPHGG